MDADQLPVTPTSTTRLSDIDNRNSISPSSATSFLSTLGRVNVSLPEPILTLIVRYLPSSSVTALSLVNHEWLTVTREQWLWKQWFVANYPHCWHQRVLISSATSNPPTPASHVSADESSLYDPEAEETESISTAMSMDCANDGIDWRREYQARSQIRSWSRSLFTPPRRRHSMSNKPTSQPFYFSTHQDDNNSVSTNSASTALSSSLSSSVTFAPVPSSSSPKSATTSQLFASPPQQQAAARTHPSPDHLAEKTSVSPSSSYNHLRTNNPHPANHGGSSTSSGNMPRSKSTSWSEERKLLQQMKHEREKYEVGELESIQGNNYAPLPPQRTHNGTHFNSHLRPMKSSFGSNGDKKSRVSKSGQLSKENKKVEKGTSGSNASSSVPPPFPTTPNKQGHSGKSPYLSPKIPSSALTPSLSMEDLSLGDAASISVSGAEVNTTSSAAPLLLTGHRSAVTCVRLDETRAAVACGQSVRVHSLENGSLLEHVKVCQHGIVTSVDFSSRLLVASGSDCTIRSFDLDSFECERISAKKQNHQDVVTAIKIAANERAMLSISLDASLKLWDLESGNCSSTINQGDRAKLGMLLCMDSISDSELIIGGSYQNNARVSLFDVRAGSVLSSVTMDAKTTQTNYGPSPATQMTCSISYSAANFTVAAGGNDGTVRVFDIRQMSDKQQPTPLLHVNVPPFQNYQHHHAIPSGGSANQNPPLPISRSNSSRAASPLTAVSSSPPVDSYLPLRPASHHSPPPRNVSPGLAHLYPPSYNPHQVALGPPVQSLHLDSNRLLLCQKRVVSIFSSSATSPAVSNGLPFAHLIHRVTLDDIGKWYNSTSGPLQLFHYMSYQEKSGLLALATTDVVLVWNKGRLVY